MADQEKDRFGSKLRDKERGQEEDYFARRDRELLERLRQAPPGAQDATRPAPALTCPRCQATLTAVAQDGISVDGCSSCGGLWLDGQQAAEVARRDEHGWLGRLLRARPGRG